MISKHFAVQFVCKYLVIFAQKTTTPLQRGPGDNLLSIVKKKEFAVIRDFFSFSVLHSTQQHLALIRETRADLQYLLDLYGLQGDNHLFYYWRLLTHICYKCSHVHTFSTYTHTHTHTHTHRCPLV